MHFVFQVVAYHKYSLQDIINSRKMYWCTSPKRSTEGSRQTLERASGIAFWFEFISFVSRTLTRTSHDSQPLCSQHNIVTNQFFYQIFLFP